jgi:DNA-binding NarL/FixJ family response regulator
LPAEVLSLLLERGATQGSPESPQALHDSIAPAKPAWASSNGDATMPRQPTVALTTIESSDAPKFSPRERLILRYLVEGRANKVIARTMCISDATVKVHIKAILRKIRVHNRTQAAIWAMNADPSEFGVRASDNVRPN